MKTCDICNSRLKFIKFRYAEGFICKECYKYASNNFSENTYEKKFAEIKVLCDRKENNDYLNEDFEITHRIGSFILFDDKNEKFCLPYNRLYFKKTTKPEIYNYNDICKCELISEPLIPEKEISKILSERNSIDIIKSLHICIYLKSQKVVKKIKIVEKPLRIKSFAFKRLYAFSSNIIEKISRIIESNNNEAIYK